MRYLPASLLFASALAGTHGEAKAEGADFNVHEAVLEEAFEPGKFFQSKYGAEPILTIRYLGDDWDFPVYAIALFKGCHVDDPDGEPSCRDRLHARMVRAPYDGEPERPRWRGTKLLGDLEERGVSNRDELRSALDQGAVEWFGADLAQCPSALAKARETDDISWFGTPLVKEPSNEIEIIMHFDTIEMRFRPNYFTEFWYGGHIDEDLPSGWAREFATALGPCWRPSSATPPWRRKPISETDDE